MSDPWVVSQGVLWLVVVVLAVVVLALARQIGLLHERIAPVGALVGAETPRVGELAPTLEVESWAGGSVRVGGVAADGRSTLLLFVSPTCPVCREVLPVARAMASDARERMRLVLASDGPREEHEAYVARNGLSQETYLLSKPLGLAYQIGRLPHAVLLDEEGVVRARGLVNTREHLESLFEARDRGVSSVQEYLAGERQDGPAAEGAEPVREANG